MGTSKVTFGNNVLVDLTGDTVAADKLLEGVTAHGADGDPVVGTIKAQRAQTITPGTSDQTIPSGFYLTGTQTIKGDTNLIPMNIVKGASIFGVEGTADTSGGTGGSEEKTTCALSLTDHTYSSPAAQYTDENGEPTATSVATDGMEVTSFVGDKVTILLPDAPDFFILNAEGVAQKYSGGVSIGFTLIGMVIFEITGESAIIDIESGGDL